MTFHYVRGMWKIPKNPGYATYVQNSRTACKDQDMRRCSVYRECCTVSLQVADITMWLVHSFCMHIDANAFFCRQLLQVLMLLQNFSRPLLLLGIASCQQQLWIFLTDGSGSLSKTAQVVLILQSLDAYWRQFKWLERSILACDLPWTGFCIWQMQLTTISGFNNIEASVADVQF